MHAYKHVIHQVIGYVCEVFESELIFNIFTQSVLHAFSTKLSVHLKKNATSDQGSQFHICISPFVHFILHAHKGYLANIANPGQMLKVRRWIRVKTICLSPCHIFLLFYPEFPLEDVL